MPDKSDDFTCASAGLTDVGNVRPNNEDALLMRDDLKLYVVADGIGGAAAGEVASQLLVESAESEFDQGETGEDLDLRIGRCIRAADGRIREHGRANPQCAGMGCTAEILVLSHGRFHLGHVGDSRTYLWRNETLTQLTRDHSFWQEQIDRGLANPSGRSESWLRNAISRAVGHLGTKEADLHQGRIEAGDVFMLCSDGLTDMVTETEIAALLAGQHVTLRDKTQALVQAAKEHGGRDNITVVLCQIT